MQPTPAGWPTDLRVATPTAHVYADDGILAETVMPEIWSSDWDGAGDLSAWTTISGTPVVSGGRLGFSSSGAIRRRVRADFVVSTDLPVDVGNANYILYLRTNDAIDTYIAVIFSATSWALEAVSGAVTTLAREAATVPAGACKVTAGVRGRKVWVCRDDRLVFSHTLTAAHHAILTGQNVALGGGSGILGFGPTTAREASRVPVSWSVSREMATDVPDQVRGVGGLSRASGEVVLTSTERVVTTEAPFSPWKPGARRRSNQGVQLSAGYDRAEVDQIHGVTVRAPGSTSDPALRLSVVDIAERLQHEVALPAVAAVIDGAYSPGFNPVWVIDHLLRSGGFFHCPPLVDVAESTFYASLMGSAEPDVYDLTFFVGGGYIAAKSDVDGSPVEYRQASWSPLAAVNVYLDGGCTDFTAKQFFVSFWVDWQASDPAGTASIEIWNDDSLFRQGIINLAASTDSVLGVATSSGRIGVLLDTDATAGSRASIYQNGALLGTGDPGAFFANVFGTAPQWVRVIVRSEGVVIGGVQVADPFDGLVDEDAVMKRLTVEVEPTAAISPSLGNLDGTPAATGTAWEILRQVAEAEQGAAWIDEAGTAVFRNRIELRTFTGTPIPVTAKSSLLELAWSESSEQLASTVEVPYTSIQVETDRVVWEPVSPRRIGPNSDMRFDVRFDSPVMTARLELTGAWQFPDGTGTNLITSIFVRNFRLLSPTRATWTIRNTDSLGAWIVVTSTGDNALRVLGTAIVAQGEDGLATATNDSPSPRTLTVGPNPFRQGFSAARDLAEWLAPQVRDPLPVLTRVPIVPDPRLQLGDLVEIQDPSVTHITQRALIVSDERAGTGDTMTQSLTVRPLSPILADVDAVWTGETLADVDAFWSGKTLTQLDADPLEVP